MSKRRNAISGQFVPHLLSMLESPAFRVLSRAAHMVLARIEIEHMHHGGKENGHLPVTYEDFVRYGIHRHAIAPAIRELHILGFINITVRGRAGNREFRSPSRYRLTYCPAKGEPGDGTHEWRWVASLEQAHQIAKRARMGVTRPILRSSDKAKRPPGRSKIPMTKNASLQCRKPSPRAPIFSDGKRHYGQ
jgi:hypothetical protein